MPSTSVPILPHCDDGTLPPLPLLLQWLHQQGIDDGGDLGLDRIPPGNGVIPSLATLARRQRLRLARPELPESFRWNGDGDQGLKVANPGGYSSGPEEARHHGPLPVDAPPTGNHRRAVERILRRVEAARLADAAAVVGRGLGADWRPPLAALASGGRPPPVKTQVTSFDEGPMRVWNPLPFARRCVVPLPTDGEKPPWSVVDHRGAKHPLQVVEGPLGEQWLIELRLGALEVVDLVPYDEPVGGAHWEVSAQVLDNGRVRAEFDDRGRVERLCFDGRFVAIDRPLVDPRLAGGRPRGTAAIRVQETGPTRGRVVVTIDGPEGHLRIAYTLHANDDLLQVSVTWHGQVDHELAIEHPFALDGADCWCCAEGAAWRLDNRPDLTVGAPPLQRGLRWARCDGAHGSLALLGHRPLTLRPAGFALPVDDGVVYALADGDRSAEQLSLGQAALAYAVPGRHAGRTKVAPPAFRLAGDPPPLALWVGRPEGWIAELLLVDQSGSAGCAECYPAAEWGPLAEARTVDVHGRRIDDLRPSKDGDAWLIPYRPGQLQIVRFR